LTAAARGFDGAVGDSPGGSFSQPLSASRSVVARIAAVLRLPNKLISTV
jgi:hypothetical protein